MGGLDGLDPVFMQRLVALQQAAAAEGRTIGWGSGTRSVEQQIQLRKDNGCPDVWTSPASSCRVPTAIPGRSNHNHGLAMDITGDKAWANQNAHRFGLHFPVAGEDWHIEMIDDDETNGSVTKAQNRGAIGFDTTWDQKPGRSPEDEVSHRIETIMSMIGQTTPDAATPEDLITPDELNVDKTTLGARGGQQGVIPQGGGAPADGDRLGNARLIAQVGREMGMTDEDIRIALSAALVESNLVNVNHGDRDSLGLFQQRPSQGWGTPEQVRDPRYAATQFFSRLRGVNRAGRSPGLVAQAVQRSAFPGRYDERYGEASTIFSQLGL